MNNQRQEAAKEAGKNYKQEKSINIKINIKVKKAGLLILIITILAILITPSAKASIDLLRPENNTYTNQATQEFEFYLGMESTNNCTLVINSQLKTTLQNPVIHDFNTIQSDLSTGEQRWMVECSSLNESLRSEERVITLDTSKPTIVLFNPQNNTIINSSTIELSFVALDNFASNLSCEVKIDETPINSLLATNSQPVSITISNLSEGSHTWKASCNDWAGNTQISETRNFIVKLPPQPPSFSISIPTNEINLGKNTLMTINAPNGTSIRVEVCPNASGFVECKVPVNAQNVMNYPFQEWLPFTNYAGRYILEAFFNKSGVTETKTLSYEVKNNIKISIEEIDNPRINTPVTLEARASGGVGTLSYTWKLSNGSEINNKKTNITYSSPGNYTNIIVVKDEYNNTMNKSITLEVENAYQVWVLVKDKQTNSPISGASIKIEDEQKETGSDGRAEYYLKPSKQEIIVLKENYEVYTGELNITKAETITILLEPIINTTPRISLTSPANNSGVIGITTELIFNTEHSSRLNCSVYINDRNDGFFIYLGSIVVNNNGEQRFGIIDLENKTYWWKVECTDNQRNTGTSDTWQFSVNQFHQEAKQEITASQTSSTGQGYAAWIREYEEVLERFNSLGKEEKEAAEALGIISAVEETLKVFSNTVRDLDSLRFRKDLSEEQKQLEAEKLVSVADEAYQKTPVNIAMIETANYVDYLQKEELETIVRDELNDYFKEIGSEEKTNNKKTGYNKKEYEALIGFLDNLQQEIVVSTKIRTAKIIYRDGSEKEMSAVIREIKVYNITQGAFIAEIIPKEIVQDAKDVKSTQRFEVLKQDPILKFKLAGDVKISYYFENRIPKDMLRRIKTAVLLEPEMISSDQLTGFTVKGISKGLESLTYLPVLVILLGGLLFAGFRYGGIDAARYAVYRLQRKRNLHYINVILNEINQNLETGNLEKALALYEEARGAYNELPRIAKNDIHDEVVNAANKISNYYGVLSMSSMSSPEQEYEIRNQATENKYNFDIESRESRETSGEKISEITSRINRIHSFIESARIEAALEEYKRIESCYNQLDEKSKEILHPALVEIGNNIQIIIDNMKEHY